jgi:hypothetical protein
LIDFLLGEVAEGGAAGDVVAEMGTGGEVLESEVLGKGLAVGAFA